MTKFRYIKCETVVFFLNMVEGTQNSAGSSAFLPVRATGPQEENYLLIEIILFDYKFKKFN